MAQKGQWFDKAWPVSYVNPDDGATWVLQQLTSWPQKGCMYESWMCTASAPQPGGATLGQRREKKWPLVVTGKRGAIWTLQWATIDFVTQSVKEAWLCTMSAPPSRVGDTSDNRVGDTTRVADISDNNIGDNRVGDTSDTTRVGDTSDTTRVGDLSDTGRAMATTGQGDGDEQQSARGHSPLQLVPGAPLASTAVPRGSPRSDQTATAPPAAPALQEGWAAQVELTKRQASAMAAATARAAGMPGHGDPLPRPQPAPPAAEMSRAESKMPSFKFAAAVVRRRQKRLHHRLRMKKARK